MPIPDYQLAHAWINAADAVHAALRAHRDDAEHRILLINASPRSEHTCPGEMSKSYRLAQIAQSVFLNEHARVDLLDLSRLSFGIRAPDFILAKPAFQHPRRSAIGHALAIRIILSGRCTIG